MTEATTETAATEPKVKARGVGTAAREAIRAGKTNEEALAAVAAEFPSAKTSLQTISWYRNDLRKGDPSIPSGRSLKPKIEKPAKAPKTATEAPAADAAAAGATVDPLA